METLRRPSVLAAVAAAVLVINVVVLAADGAEPDPGGDTTAAPATGDDATTDPADQGPAAGDAEPGTPTAGEDGEAGAGTNGDAAAGDAGGGTTGDGGASDDAQDQPAADDQDVELGVPLAGTYGYSSSGSWSLDRGGESEQYQLPATATATVEVDGDDWQLRRAAGERYADRFGYVLAADGGLDWRSWVVERVFSSGPNETTYSCSGDSAFYRPDEQGRVVEHDCETAGIRSDGQVEHLGSEDVTLSDGTVVSADRLLYTYTVSGTSDDFDVTGEGRLDLWLDPATGLRVRELRTISTTTTGADGGQTVYQEDVDLTLQALQPS